MALIDVHGLGDVQTALDNHETRLLALQNGGSITALSGPASIGGQQANATLGSEELTNGSVSGGSTSWTLSGATYSANALHFASNGDVASQTIAGVVSGQKYLVSWTQVPWPGQGVDLFTVAIGSATQTMSPGGSTAVVVTAADNGSVTFSVTATAISVGVALNNFSCKPIAANGVATAKLLDGGGTDRADISADALNNLAIGTGALLKFVGPDGNGSNSAFGASALANLAFGQDNHASGVNALQQATVAEFCTAVGEGAMQAMVWGYDNTAIGTGALGAITTGVFGTTAIGTLALASNTSGQINTAVGNNALAKNTTGSNNIAIGCGTLAVSTTGSNNTAIGTAALGAATTQSGNTAIGTNALAAATVTASGGNNTAVGAFALGSLTANQNNAAVGYNALHSATSNNNAALGYQAGYTGGGTAGNATATGHDCVFLGANAGPGSSGAGGSSFMIAIGSGATAIGGGAVAIGTDSSGNAAAATTGNDFVLGTANHTLKVPGNANLAGSGKTLGFYGTTAVAQPNTTGTTTGFTAATGTTVVSGSTFTGNSGSTAYTIGDVVNALKKLGLMAA